MKNQIDTQALVINFIAQGGEITVCKPKKNRKRAWFAAAKGRATAFAQLRKCDAEKRGSKHCATDASYVAM